MEIIIKNLGPISEGRLDLSSPLTLISGQNNTGKTYLSTLIYAIYRSKYNLETSSFSLLNSIDHSYHDDGMIVIEADVIDFFEQNKKIIEEQVQEVVKKNLSDFFSTQEGVFSNTEIEIYLNKRILKKAISYSDYRDTRVHENIDGEEVEIDIYRKKNNSNVEISLFNDERNIDFLDERFIMGTLSKHCIELLFPPTFFIPAERQGIALFYKELNIQKNQLFDTILGVDTAYRNGLIDFLQKNVNVYSRPILDYLSFYQQLNAKEFNAGSFGTQNLERAVYDGEIFLDKQGEPKFRVENKVINLNNVSSTVKSLMGLSLYLQTRASSNHFIIIDEPELNLHPDNQITVIRFLARLVNMGFKLLISTHSEYMIRELNHLIMLEKTKSQATNGEADLYQRLKYQSDELLKSTDVVGFIMKKGKPIQQMEMSEYGLIVTTIEKTTDMVNQVFNELLYNLD